MSLTTQDMLSGVGACYRLEYYDMVLLFGLTEIKPTSGL